MLLSANQSEHYFQFEFSWYTAFIFHLNEEHVFYAMRDHMWLVSYDTFETNQLEAQLLVATFVRGLCSGTISLYIYLWRWRPLSSEGSLACHTYCDMGHQFLMAISEDPRDTQTCYRAFSSGAVTSLHLLTT